MIIGFTGTQKGMTLNQKREIKELLLRCSTLPVIHHGGCIGSDLDFHNICQSLGIHTVYIHPASDVADIKKASFTTGMKWVAKPALKRNHDIVDVSDVLFATPKSNTEELRSGTWATIRYARKKNKPVYIINP